MTFLISVIKHFSQYPTFMCSLSSIFCIMIVLFQDNQRVRYNPDTFRNVFKIHSPFPPRCLPLIKTFGTVFWLVSSKRAAWISAPSSIVSKLCTWIGMLSCAKSSFVALQWGQKLLANTVTLYTCRYWIPAAREKIPWVYTCVWIPRWLHWK